ncbi:MAG TPA: hypothetical protein VLJ10_00590, partial [Candidatus Bathyarchaeia archaeon]|nr:hypothetical protein [Candidatus Bathyarchaeia archaeon]
MQTIRVVARTSALALVFLFIGIGVCLAQTSGVGEASMSEQINMLVLQLSVILVAAWLGGRIFRRLKFPTVLGELVSG